MFSQPVGPCGPRGSASSGLRARVLGRIWQAPGMAMIPPTGVEDFGFSLEDAFDIPVRVLSDGTLNRWHRSRWPKAAQPWPGGDALPGDGEYLATTTWRQLVMAATGAGRDLAPWLRQTPHFAVNELVARVSPLQAYLSLRDVPAPEGGAGRRLFVSPVYRHGTERSAHAAFGYHLGMTMAQWLTVGMGGLPATVHLEASGIPELTDPSKRLPDLYGNHLFEAMPWLIEAKARKELGLPDMRSGQGQLDRASEEIAVPHRQVLCGTSLPGTDRWESDSLFMMVHTAIAAPSPGGGVQHLPNAPAGGGAPPLSEDPEDLLRVARDQLLVFRALAFGAVEDLRVVPLGGAGTEPRRSAGRAEPLERDVNTRFLREQALGLEVPYEWVRELPGVREFIVGRIPGIGLHLGLSRGLYAACARLHQVQADVPVEERLFPAERIFSRRGEDEEREEISREARRSFYEREYGRLGRARQEMADAYIRQDVPPEFLRRVRLAPQPPQTGGGLLEARTDETYVAVERTDPVLAARR